MYKAELTYEKLMRSSGVVDAGQLVANMIHRNPEDFPLLVNKPDTKRARVVRYLAERTASNIIRVDRGELNA